LLKLDPAKGTVTFAYKLRRDPAPPKWTEMELDLTEFVRRFCLHILPGRLVKIRHYGLLANRGRQQRVAQARALLGGSPVSETPTVQTSLNAPDEREETPEQPLPLICPYCGARALVLVETVSGPVRVPT
jgi:hypothetical protein